MRGLARAGWLALVTAIAFAAPAAADESTSPVVLRWLETLPVGQAVVDTGEARHAFTVWVASTPWQKAHGLMHVKSLAPDRGMLFLLGEPQYASFWMHNTFVALDLVFIGEDGRIVNIVERAEPLTTTPRLSTAPVTRVLEIAGGTAGRLGIRPGQRVEFRLSPGAAD